MSLSKYQKNDLRDMLRSNGWKILDELIKEQADSYRRMATRRPGQNPPEERTWYSGAADGLEEALFLAVDNATSQKDEDDS